MKTVLVTNLLTTQTRYMFQSGRMHIKCEIFLCLLGIKLFRLGTLYIHGDVADAILDTILQEDPSNAN